MNQSELKYTTDQLQVLGRFIMQWRSIESQLVYPLIKGVPFKHIQRIIDRFPEEKNAYDETHMNRFEREVTKVKRQLANQQRIEQQQKTANTIQNIQSSMPTQEELIEKLDQLRKDKQITDAEHEKGLKGMIYLDDNFRPKSKPTPEKKTNIPW